jgi:hypothetical protein
MGSYMHLVHFYQPCVENINNNATVHKREMSF